MTTTVTTFSFCLVVADPEASVSVNCPVIVWMTVTTGPPPPPGLAGEVGLEDAGGDVVGEVVGATDIGGEVA